MLNNSVCIRCGTFKSDFDAACPKCQFTPEEDVDIVKSRILGPLYSFAKGDGTTVDTGRSTSDLKAIASEIQSGVPYIFPEEEFNSLLNVWLEVQAMPPKEQWAAILPTFFGAIIVLVGIGYALWEWFH